MFTVNGDTNAQLIGGSTPVVHNLTRCRTD